MRHTIAVSAVLSALILSAASANAASAKNGRYCLHENKGATNCSFQTMAACEKAKTGNSDNCTLNKPKTTGSGAGMQSGMKK
ncbi:MAG TPA: DUF3551 domain-containing protein [Pseudolabrys sp.]|jgi:hypothetical protein|nr:DUF3551 domain-containing protein [Pseudolabrys sp.]